MNFPCNRSNFVGLSFLPLRRKIQDFLNGLLRNSPAATVLVAAAAAAAKSLQSWLTLCDTRDGSPPGSPIPGILQARTLEWVAMSFSNAWKGKVKVKSLSHVQPFVTPWSAAYQTPPSMGFSRQEYWSRVPLPSPKILSRSRAKSRLSACLEGPEVLKEFGFWASFMATTPNCLETLSRHWL